MKRFKSIYEQPRRYARKCNMPLKYAREICKKHLKNYREVRKHSLCPYCHKRTLERDWSDSEYSDDTWIECDSCGREVDESLFFRLKVPNSSDDFDMFLWCSHDKDFESIYGKGWVDFVKENK